MVKIHLLSLDPVSPVTGRNFIFDFASCHTSLAVDTGGWINHHGKFCFHQTPFRISDYHQSWGYEDDPVKGPGQTLLVAADFKNFLISVLSDLLALMTTWPINHWYLVCLSHLWWWLFCWLIPRNCKKYTKKNFISIHKPPVSIRFAPIKHALAITVEPFKFSPAGGLWIVLL